MADPLSPLSPANTNRIAPTIAERNQSYVSPEKRVFAKQDAENIPFDNPSGPPSSPFVADVGPSPTKRQSAAKHHSSAKAVAVHQDYVSRPLTEDALRENEGLTMSMKTMEDSSNEKIYHRAGDDAVSTSGGAPGFAGMDDTCFSAFSAVPNADMTRFANIGQSPVKSAFKSPTKSQFGEGPTPRPASRNTPSRNRQQQYDDGYSSPTPRRHKSSRDGDTTNLLVDFTEQFNAITHTSDRSPSRNGRLSPSKKYHNQPDLASFASGRRTPSPSKCPLPPGTPSEAHHLANLLDFDLPPPPTPRSIPSISARELESMKSAFQSQISSLIATLKGKDAEVSSLKGAVEDAERRVGEAQEQIREERGAKEGLQAEKTDWEERQQEMQGVLKNVKEEIIRGDREKDQLSQRLQDADQKRLEAETKIIEAESKIAGLGAANSTTPSTPASAETGTNSNSNIGTNPEVEAAVTKVARELHGLYKSKHELKVTALKKSYSDRWEKKIKDMQCKIDELSKENEDLRVGRDATMTAVAPNSIPSNSTTNTAAESPQQKAEQTSHLKRLESQSHKLENLEQEVTSLQRELATSKSSNASLTTQLSSSRLEITDLIAATEELMSLSSSSADQPPHHAPTERTSFTRSTSGSSSGLRAPGFGGESRIGRMGGPSAGRDRSGSGLGGARSGIMSNIERMGRGSGRAAADLGG